MVVDTGTAILILAVFVLLGFITLIFRERLYVVRGQETPFERLLSALFYSALIYGALLAAAHGCGLAILLLLPGAIAGSRCMKSRSLRPSVLGVFGGSDTHSTASGWNQLFGTQGACLVRATLSDGRIVGGFYDEPSLAGYSEQTQDLYVNQRWELDDDGWFVGPAERSLGIWLPKESIISLEIYDAQTPLGEVDMDGQPPDRELESS
jgi:hypothetical protein